MTGTLPQLAAAVGMFVASHIVMAWAPVRGPLAARFGRWGFMAMYSGVSAALLGWAIQAYAAAPVVVLTEPGTALKHGALTLMLIATFFIVAGYTTPNPGIMGMEQVGLRSGARGVLKITRHPVMWGVALWGIAHALANGHVAAWLFFGGMTVLALAGAAHIDAKRRAQHGDAWIAYQDATSFWPLGAVMSGRARVERGEIPWWQSVLTIAVYTGMLWAHAKAGRDVFPMNVF